jgi:hypothetical protein
MVRRWFAISGEPASKNVVPIVVNVAGITVENCMLCFEIAVPLYFKQVDDDARQCCPPTCSKAR